VYQERLNDWYETHQTTFALEDVCISKLDRCNDCKICGKLPVDENVETPVTSTCLSANCLELKTDRMSNKLLYTASAASHKHHLHVKLVFVIGDINAKIGRGLDGEEGIIGLHGIDCDRNDNGERFTSFCTINNLAVVTTMFKHKDIHLQTWMSPNGQHRNQIDR
jgi:hypothetical protein